jgi:hypothetical protein
VPSTRLKSPLAQAIGPLLAGVGFLVLLALALWGVAAYVSSHSGPGSKLQVRLGDQYFDLGSDRQRAKAIAQDGPFLYPGLIGPDKGYIVVNHLGSDESKGWYAFAATAPGQPISCVVQWKADAQHFADPCTGTVYPANGQGLLQYDVSITPQGTVLVDLRTTTSPSTT